MDVLAEFRLYSVAASEDRAVMIVPRRKAYAVRTVNYFPVNSHAVTNFPLPRVDYSRHVSTLVEGSLSVCWTEFVSQVDYLSRVYRLSME